MPELASRAHVQAIGSVVDRALADAGIGLGQLDGIAVTAGPGLVGALLVGVMYGKTLAFSLDRPLLGVNHLEGHLFAPTLEDPELAPPFVALLVSGGHTMLLDVPGLGRVPAAGADARRRRRRGVRQGGQAARARLSRRAGDRAAGAARDDPAASAFPVPCCQELERDGTQPLRLLLQRAQDRGAARGAAEPTRRRAADRADGCVAAASRTRPSTCWSRRPRTRSRRSATRTAMIGGGVACNRTLADRLRERLAGRARVSVASPGSTPTTRR